MAVSPGSDEFSPLTEQHAVQELTKASMSGVAIDGEVLSYLELAQVSVHRLLKILWSAAGLAFSSSLVLSIAYKWLKVCSSESAVLRDFISLSLIKLSFIFCFKEGFFFSSKVKYPFK